MALCVTSKAPPQVLTFFFSLSYLANLLLSRLQAWVLRIFKTKSPRDPRLATFPLRNPPRTLDECPANFPGTVPGNQNRRLRIVPPYAPPSLFTFPTVPFSRNTLKTNCLERAIRVRRCRFKPGYVNPGDLRIALFHPLFSTPEKMGALLLCPQWTPNLTSS